MVFGDPKNLTQVTASGGTFLTFPFAAGLPAGRAEKARRNCSHCRTGCLDVHRRFDSSSHARKVLGGRFGGTDYLQVEIVNHDEERNGLLMFVSDAAGNLTVKNAGNGYVPERLIARWHRTQAFFRRRLIS